MMDPKADISCMARSRDEAVQQAKAGEINWREVGWMFVAWGIMFWGARWMGWIV